MATDFDFVIVGGGTAGCLLANRLASTKSTPSVLLIEIGGDVSNTSYRNPYERYLNAFIYPELDQGYATMPQAGLGGKVVPYARGKGLGGSTATNFMIYTPGSSADFNRWADIVGDRDWAWDVTKERLRRIENFHGHIPDGAQNYSNPKTTDHGYRGPVDVSLPAEWESETRLILDAAVELEFSLNPDMNSGSPIGFGVAVSSSFNGLRTTSASANILSHQQSNLVIWINERVTKILFEGKKATGIETASGKRAHAAKEVILTAGAIDTPKLLLLSGVGPATELSAKGLDIEVIHDLPGVGKGLQDHCGVFLSELMEPEFSPKAKFSLTPDEVARAKGQWNMEHTGPFTQHYSSVVMSFVKESHTYDSVAFKELEPSIQGFLRDPSVPTFELLFNGPLIPPSFPLTVDDGFMCTLVVLMNPQSRGQVTLASANPTDAPLIDFNYMNSSYDREVLIEAISQAMKFPRTTALRKYWKRTILAPKSESKADIWEFIQDCFSPLWHANGTVMMGKESDESACVDTQLKVFGMENLRVADLSVCPLTPSSHTQSTAYLIGQAAAEKIIAEYGLDL